MHCTIHVDFAIMFTEHLYIYMSDVEQYINKLMHISQYKLDMKQLLLLLIFINCHMIQVSGVLEWTVTGKATDYGQNVTLFCHVPNCCPKDAGWDRWTPVQRTLFIDVKTGRSNKKYDGKAEKDGYTLIIQNLTKDDLNVSYSCLYGVTLGQSKFLLEEDVFTDKSDNKPTGRFSGIQITGIIIGVVVPLAVAVVVFVILYKKKRKKRSEVHDPLLDTEEPSSIEYIEGDDATLTCQVGPKNLHVDWLKDGKAVKLNRNCTTFRQGTEHNLIIKNVKPDDSGEYHVQVGNFSRKIQLKIIVYFLKDPSDIKCKEGEDAIFTCNVMVDSPSLLLLKDGNDITRNTNILEMPPDGTQRSFKLINTKQVDKGEYCMKVGKSSRKFKLNFKEIPSTNERNKIWDAMKSGTESRQYVRIQVIGKDGVGKTSLVRRLLGKQIDDVESTDGIDIDKTCQIKTSDGEWIVGEVETERMEMIRRLQQAVDTKHTGAKTTTKQSLQSEQVPSKDELLEQEQTRNTHKQNLSKGQSMDTGKGLKKIKTNEPTKLAKHLFKQDNKGNEHEPTASGDLHVEPASKTISDKDNLNSVEKGKLAKHGEMGGRMKDESTLSPVNQNFQTNDRITIAVLDEMDAIIVGAKNQKEKMISEGLVKCGIWDFAGQKDYYATHQTFFTPNAIYLLVADITKDIKSFKQDEESNSSKDRTKDVQTSKQDEEFNSIEDYIDFWFDCVHCLCEDGSDHETQLCPPVIVVCTGTDKYKKVDVECRIKNYEEQFKEVFYQQTKVNHKRGIYFVSNIEDGNKGINDLKCHISNIAKQMNYFVEELPTKWIHLENALSVMKGLDINVYEWGNILKLAQKNSIEEDELLLFLEYQHRIGNIICFKELKEYIILQPFWLIKCFRCLVNDCSPDQRNCVLSETDVQTLQITGELSETLIEKLFQKEDTLHFTDSEHKRHLLSVMEKFNIIVKPEFRDINSNKCQKSESYYLPCMIKTSRTLVSIKNLYIQGNVELTPWLVLEFTFLPLAYFNHILFYYLQNYNVCKVETEQPALFMGKAVFHLDRKKSSKFIVCFSRNTICLQIWKWKDVDENIYEKMFNELCDKIENIRDTIGRNISYITKAKCSSGDFTKSAGRISFTDLEVTEGDDYMCDEHNDFHSKEDLVNTWLIHGFNRKKQEQAKQEEEKKRREEEEFTKAKPETSPHTREFSMVGDEVIPKHISEQFENRLEQWKKDDQQYVSTEAEKHVMQKVLTQSSVTLIGTSGTGKSFLSKHIALKMMKNGYTVIPCRHPEDIGKWFKHGRKTFFVFDDVCGRYTLNEQIYTDWKGRLDHIKSLLQDTCCKIISTCRLEVYKDEHFSNLSIFKMCNIDLSSQEFKLSAAERNTLAEVYFKDNAGEVKELSKQYDCFPLLCSLYHKQNLQTNVSISSFFNNPFDFCKDQLIQMYSEDDAGKRQYCSLVLCVMFNNTLTEENLSSKDIKIEAVIENLLEECEVNERTSIKRFKKSLEILEGTYVVKENSTYKIMHDKLFDFLAKYFGEKMLQIFIDHANTDFIKKRFLWKTRDNTDTEIEFEIRIPDKYIDAFIYRLLKDWENGYVNNVCQNRNMKCTTFTENFITILNHLDLAKQKELACTQDIHKKDIALVGSCDMGIIELVKWLISRNSDINYCRNDGCFPLLLASQKGHVDVVKELLQHSADVNQCNNEGASPLYVASQSGHVNVVKKLLQFLADVNKCDVEGKSPLKVAQENGYFEIESLLLKNGTNRN